MCDICDIIPDICEECYDLSTLLLQPYMYDMHFDKYDLKMFLEQYLTHSRYHIIIMLHIYASCYIKRHSLCLYNTIHFSNFSEHNIISGNYIYVSQLIKYDKSTHNYPDITNKKINCVDLMYILIHINHYDEYLFEYMINNTSIIKKYNLLFTHKDLSYYKDFSDDGLYHLIYRMSVTNNILNDNDYFKKMIEEIDGISCNNFMSKVLYDISYIINSLHTITIHTSFVTRAHKNIQIILRLFRDENELQNVIYKYISATIHKIEDTKHIYEDNNTLHKYHKKINMLTSFLK